MLGVSKAIAPADIFQSQPWEGPRRPAGRPGVCGRCGLAAATACPPPPDPPARVAAAIQELLPATPAGQIHHAVYCVEGDGNRAVTLLLRHSRPLGMVEGFEATPDEPPSLVADAPPPCGADQLDVQRLLEVLYAVKAERESVAWRLMDAGLLEDLDAQWAAIAADLQDHSGCPVDDAGPGYWPRLPPTATSPPAIRLTLPSQQRLPRLFAAALAHLGQDLVSVEYLRNPETWSQFSAAQQSARQPVAWKLYSAPFSSVDSICAADAPVARGQWLLAGRCPSRPTSGAQPTKGERALFLCRTLLSPQGPRKSPAFEGPIFPELLVVYCPATLLTAGSDSLTSA